MDINGAQINYSNNVTPSKKPAFIQTGKIKYEGDSFVKSSKNAPVSKKNFLNQTLAFMGNYYNKAMSSIPFLGNQAEPKKYTEEERLEFAKSVTEDEWDRKSLLRKNDKEFARLVELHSLGINPTSFETSVAVSYEDSQYERLLGLIKEGIKFEYATSLSYLKDEASIACGKRFMQRGVSSKDILGLANLEPNQEQRAVDLLEKGVDSAYLSRISRFNDEAYAKAVERIDSGEEHQNVSDFGELDDKEYQRALEVKSKGCKSNYDIEKFVKLSDKEYETAILLLDCKVDAYNALRYSSLDEKHIEKLVKHLKEGDSIYQASSIAELSDTDYERFLILKESGLDTYSSLAILEAGEKAYLRAVELLEKKINDCYVDDFAKLDDKTYSRVKKSIDEGNEGYVAHNISKMDDTAYQRYLQLTELGVKASDASNAARTIESEQEFKQVVAFFEAGVEYYHAKGIIEKGNEAVERALKLKAAGATQYHLEELCRYQGEDFDFCMKLLNAGMDSYGIKQTMSLVEPSSRDKFFELAKRGVYYSKANEIAQFDDDRYQKVLTLLNLGVKLDSAIKASGNEKYYDSAIRYFKKNSSNISNFMASDGYDSAVKKAASGKYQNELFGIFSTDSMKYSTRSKIINSGLNEEDMLSSVKKLSKSTFKLAMNTPNQYLSGIPVQYTTKTKDGKYPKLPDNVMKEQQKEIKEFFDEHSPEILRALKYIDTDTLNQMMDKRTELFATQLANLDSLDDENYALLSDLLKCKSKETGKALNAKEKIQLSQLVLIYQNGRIDNKVLKNFAKTGEVDIESVKNNLSDSIFVRAGISEDEIEKIPADKKHLNEEFSYLVLMNGNTPAIKNGIKDSLKEMRPMDEETREEAANAFLADVFFGLEDDIASDEIQKQKDEIIEVIKNMDDLSDSEACSRIMKIVRNISKIALKTNDDTLWTVLKQAVTGDFHKFITDESNIYGQTNAETGRIFEQNGLDYKKWLNPELEDSTVNFKENKLTMKMWERRPQEDLFMGNKTTCCTAIGTGGNAASTPVYLLNTAFNVIDLFDPDGNLVGMSRVYMGNVDGENSLIMDNIELNATYFKGSSEKELKEIRNSFFNYIHEYCEKVTGDKDSPVYFYANDVHVPTEDLSCNAKKAHFIGKVSQNSVYINAAGCKWINPEEMDDVSMRLIKTPDCREV